MTEAEVVIRPFGEGGAQLGMSRAEMLEHLPRQKNSWATFGTGNAPSA
jgi:hypothetical protein